MDKLGSNLAAFGMSGDNPLFHGFSLSEDLSCTANRLASVGCERSKAVGKLHDNRNEALFRNSADERCIGARLDAATVKEQKANRPLMHRWRKEDRLASVGDRNSGVALERCFFDAFCAQRIV